MPKMWMEKLLRGKTKMKYAQVVKAVNEVLNSYSITMTLRQIYYRLVSKYAYPNTKSSYKNLSRQLVKE